MKKVILVVLAAIGAMAILAVTGALMIGLLSVLGEPGVPRRAFLELDLEKLVIEAVPDDPFGKLMLDDALQVLDVVDALDQAANDDRVRALVAWIGAGRMGMSHIQEIRDAVARFRASGKPAIAFAETFGEFGPGNGGYYLASAFDEIYLQPTGDIGLTGLRYESPFIRGALDKLGIVPRMDQRREYKNAMNYYTETEYTEPHREAMQRLVDSQFEQLVEGVATARGLSTEEVRSLVDRGPFLAQEALDAALVDGLAYRDEISEKVRAAAGERSVPIGLPAYLSRAGRPNRRGTTVALIQGYGAIARGSSSYSPWDGSIVMGSKTVASALRDAIDDPRVEAILFRVDSPGGSYVACDTIWHETIRAREAGKPVIVSMGNLAGSAGYYVAMDANKIVAQPGTITASIGVVGGKLVTSGFWEKLGITFDEVASSANGAMWSSSTDYSEAEYARFQDALDWIYDDFTAKVAEGRGLELERVQEIAKGRIWTGADALEIGLVDELGGFDVALRLTREAIGLDADAPLRLKRFPRPRSTFEMFFQDSDDHQLRAGLVALSRSLRAVQPLARVLTRIAGPSERGVLTMPEVAP